MHEIKRLSRDTVSDFRALLSCEPEGWCWCVAWEVTTWDGWTERTAEANRELRERLWEQGEFHGYIFYLDRAPIGWCRVGPARTWPKLCKDRGIDSESEDYVFTCFGMTPEHRKHGNLHVFLGQVLADLKSRGVRRVVASPKNLEGRQPDGRVWNGPKAVFIKANFKQMTQSVGHQLLQLDL